VKLNQQNIFVRFILRAMDVLVTLLLYQGVNTSRRLDRESFQKATEAQKRIGGLFMALWPIFLLVGISSAKSFWGWMDSHIVWQYAAFIGIACFGVFIAFKVAPKIPLYVSIPIAVIMWPILGWFVWKHLI
jgi:hypothetical protein